MQWVGLIISFVVGFYLNTIKATAYQVANEVANQGRKIVFLALLGLIGATLFSNGMMVSVLEATRQYDASEPFANSATFLSGLSLVALSIIIFAIVFRFAWPQITVKGKPETVNTPNLEQTLISLLLSFSEEQKSSKKPGDV